MSQASNKSKSYPKIEISEQDAKTDKGSQSWSDRAAENAREFIEHRDLEDTAFEDGDLPRESRQASPVGEQQTPTQPRAAPALTKVSEVAALNCQNYFKKQNHSSLHSSRNKDTARALYGSKKKNMDIK